MQPVLTTKFITMGTNNFLNRNANKVYAVCMNEQVKYSECSECDEKIFEYDEDGYLPEGTKDCPVCGGKDCVSHDEESRSLETDQYEDSIEYFKETLAEHPLHSDGGSDDTDRNFYGTSLGYFGKSKQFGDITVEVRVPAMLRSGYYEGANLDYNDPEIYVDGDEAGDVSDLARDFDYANSSMNDGMKKIQAGNAAKWAAKAIDEATSQLEEVYTKIAMPLIKVAQFSNGEAMYQKAV